MTDDEMKTLRVSTEAFHDDGGLDAFREIFGREILTSKSIHSRATRSRSI
jgi:hypothetical protein